MDSVKLIHRHQIKFQINRFDALFQVAHHQLFAQCFLLRKSRRVHCLKSRQPLLQINPLLRRICQRSIAPPVVVSVISHRRRIFWRLPHLIFPLFSQQRVELLPPPLQIRRIRGPTKPRKNSRRQYQSQQNPSRSHNLPHPTSLRRQIINPNPKSRHRRATIYRAPGECSRRVLGFPRASVRSAFRGGPFS